MKHTFKDLATMATSRFLNFYQINYLNKSQDLKQWMMTSRKSKADLEAYYNKERGLASDAVVIVALHQDSGRLVMLKQHRMPLNDYVYELPAGLIDPGESVQACVARELKEETGLQVLTIEGRPVQLVSSPGMSDEAFDLVHCRCQGQVTTAFLEEDEDIETLLLDEKAVKDLLDQGPLMDVKAYHACQWFLALTRK